MICRINPSFHVLCIHYRSNIELNILHVYSAWKWTSNTERRRIAPILSGTEKAVGLHELSEASLGSVHKQARNPQMWAAILGSARHSAIKVSEVQWSTQTHTHTHAPPMQQEYYEWQSSHWPHIRLVVLTQHSNQALTSLNGVVYLCCLATKARGNRAHTCFTESGAWNR